MLLQADMQVCLPKFPYKPSGVVPKSLCWPKAGAKHPELQNHPHQKWSGRLPNQPQIAPNSSETNNTSPEIIPKPAPSRRPPTPAQKWSRKATKPAQKWSGEPKHQTGFGQVKTGNQNFWSKLSVKTFGQNSGTQTLYNFYKTQFPNGCICGPSVKSPQTLNRKAFRKAWHLHPEDIRQQQEIATREALEAAKV